MPSSPRLTIAIFVAVACTGAGAAQFHLPHLKLPAVVDDLAAERLLHQDPPITTGLADAVTDVPYLDGYTPHDPIPMESLGADATGVYNLFGGDFSLVAQSYCLHAGAYAPGSGDGYVTAPLRGPDSDIIRHILQRSVAEPDIPQPTIQVLLWAILARSKPSEMSPELQRAASRLLDGKEISRLDGGALGHIPDSVMARLESRVPAPVQRAFELDQRVRDLVSQGSANFQQLEQIAVPVGVPVPEPGDRPIPSGRWSWDPAGYFVRYNPSSFLETKIDVSVPRPIAIARDARGRISEVRDRVRRLAITYDDGTDATVDRNRQVRAVRFASIAFQDAAAAVVKDVPVIRWERTGWTLVGVPADGDEAAASDAYDGLAQRYRTASQQAREIRDVLTHVHAAAAEARDDLADLTHLRNAIADLSAAAPKSTIWPTDLDGFLAEAWQTAFAARAGVAAPGADPPFDPSGSAAVPGQAGRQRLAQSGRPAQPHCAGQDTPDGFGSAVSNGMGVGLGDVSVSEGGSMPTIAVRTRGGCPLPNMACISQSVVAGTVPPGSVQGADYMILGSIEQVNGETRVFLRAVNVETGVVVDAGMGDANGTGADAVQQATAAAKAALNAGFPLGGSSCQ